MRGECITSSLAENFSYFLTRQNQNTSGVKLAAASTVSQALPLWVSLAIYSIGQAPLCFTAAENKLHFGLVFKTVICPRRQRDGDTANVMIRLSASY